MELETKNTSSIKPKRKGKAKWLFQGVLWLMLVAAGTSVLVTISYRWINPPSSLLMVERYFFTKQTRFNPINKQWCNINSISPHMIQAVVAAEDNLFTSHYGFDFEAIKKVQKERLSGKRVRGASTISMQVAKNTFLWSERTWTRKVLEAGFTVLIETFWSKRRIMEVYLNVTEFGPSIYGVKAAALHYYKKQPHELTPNQAAMLATILPSPLNRNPLKPTKYMQTYQQRVLRNMQNIGKVNLLKPKY